MSLCFKFGVPGFRVARSCVSGNVCLSGVGSSAVAAKHAEPANVESLSRPGNVCLMRVLSTVQGFGIRRCGSTVQAETHARFAITTFWHSIP